MKRIAPVIIFLMLAMSIGCAKKRVEVEEKSIIGEESLTRRFKGYRTAVEIKARASELEKELLNPKLMQISTSLLKIEFLSGEKFQKPGDRVDFKISAFGFGFDVRAILVNYQPGREVWYVGQGGSAIMLFRFRMEEQGEMTRLNLSSELLEEGGSDFQTLAQLVDINKLIAQGFEGVIANLQVQFDPALKKDELLAKGIRGEFFESFYVGHKVTMHIEARGEDIFQVFKDPSFWSEFEGQTGVKAAPCFYQLSPGVDPGVCPVQVKVFGETLTLDTILSAHSFERYVFNYFYWGDSRFQFEMDFSEQGGTDLTVFYLTPSVSLANPAMLNLAINFNNIPEVIKTRFLPLIKSRAEQKALESGAGK